MKGWIDRVFRYGLAYDFPDGDESGAPIGLLKAQTALVFNTSNTPRERELRVFGDPLELIWKNCIFAYCGVTNVRRRMFEMVGSPAEVVPIIKSAHLWCSGNVKNHYCYITTEMVVTSTAEQRKSRLDEVREMVQSSFPPTMRGTT
jgi:hypothetical protein